MRSNSGRLGPAISDAGWQVADPARPPRYEDPIGPGARNAALTSLAGAARRRGADRDAILALLRSTNRARCRPPLDDLDDDESGLRS